MALQGQGIDAIIRSIQSMQQLEQQTGLVEAGSQYSQEKNRLEDELARIEQTAKETEKKYGAAGRKAEEKTSHDFLKGLMIAAGTALIAAYGAPILSGALVKGGLIAKGGTAAKALKGVSDVAKLAGKFTGPTKTRAAGMALRTLGATGVGKHAVEAGRETLGQELGREDVPTEIKMQDVGGEFLTQEKKRAVEETEEMESKRKTAKEVMEGAYEKVGGASISPVGFDLFKSYVGGEMTLQSILNIGNLFGDKQGMTEGLSNFELAFKKAREAGKDVFEFEVDGVRKMFTTQLQ